jgi:Helix-turn-helix domain
MPTPWTTRVWQEYRAGNLTRAARDVLLTLHAYRGHGGAAWPSHATLADRARCCAKTVGRALAQAQGLGLVSWVEAPRPGGLAVAAVQQPLSVRDAGGAGARRSGRTGSTNGQNVQGWESNYNLRHSRDEIPLDRESPLQGPSITICTFPPALGCSSLSAWEPFIVNTMRSYR